ncbi:MAG: 2-amino-4-hydroxy-6-hydroxymethyldihydropteridine diphosphokinase [Lachnospiraceae bacterium]|nr:2-amino-4-hydroxy-6-hydroxymethyldihydropteridine diphosphokinase [Lachnospiraceae bacterium]
MMIYQDEIRINELECFAYHGVHSYENEKGQNFYVNASLYTETRSAGIGDDLSLTVNYGEVMRFITEFMIQDTFKLIETVAEKLAVGILLKFPLVNKLDLEVRKPNAPIELKFESVSVKITRGWNMTYVAVGSNLGDSEKLIADAVDKITAHPYIREFRSSALFKSSPYGVANQPDFLNGVFSFRTLLMPGELLSFLKGLEQEAGRVKSVHWGQRTLDLDILFWNELVMNDEKLTIPHPDMQNRDFVLKPLAELCPYLKHPILNLTIRQLLDELSDKYISS